MQTYTSITASLVSLGLITAIYLSCTRARPGSIWREDSVSMVLVCIFLGTMTLAVATTVSAAMEILGGGFGIGNLASATLDLVAIAALLMCLALFRAAAIAAASERADAETRIEPMPPHLAVPPRDRAPTDRAA